MLTRGALGYTTATGIKTSQIKKLIGGMVTNLRVARAARTLESLYMLKRGALGYTTATGMKTSQINKLIGGMVTNLRAARAARTLE